MKPGPLQTAWLAALRSGKYPQSKHKLKTEDGYCCLGVACEVFGLKANFNETYKRESAVLPQEVEDGMKFFSNNGAHVFDGDKCLTAMNDAGASFAEIADEVERNLSCYFKEPA